MSPKLERGSLAIARSIGSRRWGLGLASAVLVACAGDPEKYEVPEDIRAEDAVFFFMDPLDGGQQLIVRLSRANFCQPSTVAEGTVFVEVGVHFPSGTSPAPGTYDVRPREADVSYAGVSYMKAGGPCGFIALTADSGSVTIDSVSEVELRGTFVGVSDSVDLRGSFVAEPCSTKPSCG
jgi:hypothetical protein